MIPPELAPALETAPWVIGGTLVILSILKTVRLLIVRFGKDRDPEI